MVDNNIIYIIKMEGFIVNQKHLIFLIQKVGFVSLRYVNIVDANLFD